MIKLKNILKEWAEQDPGPKRWFKPYGDKYTEFEKATNHTNKELKESDRYGFASGTNYIPDDTDPDGRNTWGDKVGYSDEEKLDKIKSELDLIQKGVSVSEREKGRYRARWSYARRPLSSTDWRTVLEFLEKQLGAKIDKEWTRNDYEANYEREEPPEWVPSIYFTLR